MRCTRAVRLSPTGFATCPARADVVRGDDSIKEQSGPVRVWPGPREGETFGLPAFTFRGGPCWP